MDRPDDKVMPSPTPESTKRKPGRPPSGKALSRADIQRDYRRRQKGNVTNNTIEALDENMALREELLRVMSELTDSKERERAEFEKGEKARRRVKELEKQLAIKS